MGDEERSGSGNPVYRHTEAAPHEGDIGHSDDERIAGHLAKVIGPTGLVFHELVSDRVHMDIHTVPPTEDYPFWTLATSGMSAKPMAVPEDVEDSEQWQHAELCIMLPEAWPMEEESLKNENFYWPFRLLKTLGRLPHDYTTWLGWGHSIPNGDPPAPYAPSTELCGALIVPPFLFGESLFVIPGDPLIHMFQVLPVTAQELQFKLDKGLDDLLEIMENENPDVYGPIDPERFSAV